MVLSIIYIEVDRLRLRYVSYVQQKSYRYKYNNSVDNEMNILPRTNVFLSGMRGMGCIVSSCVTLIE